MASEMSVPRTAQVFAGRNPATGKVQFLIKTFSREKDAQQWARAMETRKDKGDRPTADRRTLAQFMAQWLGQKAQGAVAGKKKGCKPGPRTMFDYQRLVARWITAPPTGLPNLGAVRLDRLTYQALEAFYDAMGKVTTAGTVRALHKLLRQALEEPARKGALARNPADLANAPRAMRHHGHGVEAEGVVVRTMTREQAEAFLAAARHDRFSALWCVLLLGGLRPGEAFGLRWPDVDFEAGAVRVVRNLIRVPGVKGYTLGPPKTKRSRRTVPLPSLAMRELKSWKVRQAEDHLAAGPAWQDGGFVFTTERGTPLHGARKSFARVCGVAGLGEWGEEPKRTHITGPLPQRTFTPAFRVYDLRHTCATLLLLAGESLKVVSERLGHASIVMTADVYAHVLPTMQRGAADKLEVMFGAGAAG